MLWDGPATIRKFAVLSWELQLWRAEPRVQVDLESNISSFPWLPVHRIWLNSDRSLHRPSLRTALVAAKEGHVLSSELGVDVVCACGEVKPSRQNFLWRCPYRVHLPRGPENEAEKRLLVSTVAFPAAAAMRNLPMDAEALLVHLRTCLFRRPVIATDGSSAGIWNRAAWAVCCQCGFSCSALGPGLDQSAPAAEVYALAVLATAVRESTRSFDIVCDCRFAVNLGNRRTCPNFFENAWRVLRDIMLQGSSCSWVPSHDKKPGWMHGSLNTCLVRNLNKQADALASALTMHKSAIDVGMEQRQSWMTLALETMLQASQRLTDFAYQHVGNASANC